MSGNRPGCRRAAASTRIIAGVPCGAAPVDAVNNKVGARKLWAHIRRYFVRAGDANPDQLTYWIAAWLERIKNLYAAHEQLMSVRAQAGDAARLQDARAAWDETNGAIDEARTRHGRPERPDLPDGLPRRLRT